MSGETVLKSHMKITDKLTIKVVVCECGKKWQLWGEEYSVHCTCGEHLVYRDKQKPSSVKPGKTVL
jgi:hypothetical protein